MPEIQTYKPFPRQQEFHRNPAKYRLFGGQAGPGKSRALLEEACLKAWRNPGSTNMLMRRTYPELQGSIIEPFLRHVFPQWREAGATYNSSEHVARLPNKAVLKFGHCQHEDDVYQYQGDEFLFIGVDELTMFTMKMWQFLTSRNRCAIPNSFPCMAGASNPGNIGHAWVRAMFVDGKPAPGMERPEQYDQADYAFIKATLEDNPIYATDEAYKKALDALPAHLYRAFRLGDWNVFAGQYFANFDRRRHVLDSKLFKRENWWPVWISIDWGFQHPACVHWHTRMDDGKVITFAELHGAGIGETALANEIATLSDGMRITDVFVGPDAFAKRGDSRTVAEQVGEVLRRNGMPYPSAADNDRIGGARLMYQLLEADQWSIADNCIKLIDCLPQMIVDEKPGRAEDVLKVDAGEGQLGDDAYDCARYGLKSMLSAKKPPFTEVMRQKLAPIEDPTSRAIFAMKLNAEHMKMKRFDGANVGASRLRWMRGAR